MATSGYVWWVDRDQLFAALVYTGHLSGPGSLHFQYRADATPPPISSTTTGDLAYLIPKEYQQYMLDFVRGRLAEDKDDWKAAAYYMGRYEYGIKKGKKSLRGGRIGGASAFITYDGLSGDW